MYRTICTILRCNTIHTICTLYCTIYEHLRYVDTIQNFLHTICITYRTILTTMYIYIYIYIFFFPLKATTSYIRGVKHMVLELDFFLVRELALVPWTEPPLDQGGQWPPLDFFFLKKLLYICVLILTILFYKITFFFPLTISLILLRVMLYSQISL